MLIDLAASSASLKRKNLIAQGKALDAYKLFYYRQKVFRIYLALYWETFQETGRRSDGTPPRHRSGRITHRAPSNRHNRRDAFLKTLWDGARRKITPDMSVEEALTVIAVESANLTPEERRRPVTTVRPPEVKPPKPERPGRRLGRGLEGKSLEELRLRVYRLMVSARWAEYRHPKTDRPLFLWFQWVHACNLLPDEMPLEKAKEIVQGMWAATPERERKRRLEHLGVPGR